MKKYLLLLLIFTFVLPAFAFEDCIIMTKGKLNNIKIQHNDVVDVFPLITISNEKNTLIVHPLKEGKTKLSIMKNEKEKIIFDINITDEKTTVSENEGFEVLTIDCPPGAYEYYFDLDSPPLSEDSIENKNAFTGVDKNSDMRLESAKQYQYFIDNLEEPPVLRGED